MLGLFVEIGGLFDLRFLLIGTLLNYMYIYKRYPISKNCREQEAFTWGWASLSRPEKARGVTKHLFGVEVVNIWTLHSRSIQGVYHTYP